VHRKYCIGILSCALFCLLTCFLTLTKSLLASNLRRRNELAYAYVGLLDPLGDDESDYEVIPIVQQFAHPDFNSETKYFDQMLVHLAYASEKQWVRLNFYESIPEENESITAIGYSATQTDGDAPDMVLQQLTIDYIPNNECEAVTDGTTSYTGLIGEDMMCVLDTGTSANKGQCYGDSGGPYLLMSDSVENDVQVGIMSW
jgi:hypothetical protein